MSKQVDSIIKARMTKYIPIYEYAQNKGTSKQNVYRWIREGKLKDIKKETVTVERLRINSEENPS